MISASKVYLWPKRLDWRDDPWCRYPHLRSPYFHPYYYPGYWQRYWLGYPYGYWSPYWGPGLAPGYCDW